MLSRNQIKFIASLQQKKFRKLHGLFVVEGPKLVFELLESNFKLESLYVVENILDEGTYNFSGTEAEVVAISEKDLQRISGMKSPNEMIAIVRIPKQPEIPGAIFKELVIYLDQLQDPGNFGTILRTADWFGIKNIVCSPDTAEIYNPKIIQASMGSFTRIRAYYEDFEDLIREAPKGLPIYATLLEGKSIYQAKLSTPAIIIVGNESRGISKELLPFVSEKITIPSPQDHTKPESLNAAVAAALVMAEFRRQMA